MRQVLKKCIEVPANSTVIEEVAPSAKFAVLKFSGNSPISDNTHVELRFDGTPEWSIWAEGHLPIELGFNGDGEKKLSIALVNSTDGAVLMSGACEYEVYA